MYNKMILALFLLAIIIDNALTLPTPNNEGEFSLRILHTNDMHSRFEQTSASSGECSKKAEAAGKCYGGFARLATLIRQARKSDNSTLFLNAGDTYQGTLWFTAHGWEIVSRFLNILKPEVISLGNHEFDEGPEKLIPFLKRTTFPVVAANLDLSKEPELEKSLNRSEILNVNGHKIGVIGYLTAETRTIAKTRNVIFLDEVTEIQNEVRKLQAEGVNILIALGHSGFEVDKKIAEEVDGIDLVIGGHTNTFLYTGQVPDSDTPEKKEHLYPYTVSQKSGRKVYVVQAYAYTKYLGNLTIDFDIHGEIKRITGEPILVDSKIEQAADVLEVLEEFRPKLNDLIKRDVGSSMVILDGGKMSCRIKECNLGNLVADAMVAYNAKQNGAADTLIAIVNSGNIMTSINKSPTEKITMGDVIAALPFKSDVVKTWISGKTLLDALEWSVSTLTPEIPSDPNGAFLQVAGINVTYDLSKPKGSKVVSVMIRCSECKDFTLEKLDMEKEYNVMMPDFITNGGNDFTMLKGLKKVVAPITMDAMFTEYLTEKSPVNPLIEGRIKFIKNESNPQETIIEEKSSANNSPVKKETESISRESTLPETTTKRMRNAGSSSIPEQIIGDQFHPSKNTTDGMTSSNNSLVTEQTESTQNKSNFQKNTTEEKNSHNKGYNTTENETSTKKSSFVETTTSNQDSTTPETTTGNGASTKKSSVVETTTSNQDSTTPETTTGNGASTKKSSVVETTTSNQDSTTPETTTGNGASTKKSSVVETTTSNQDSTTPETTTGNGASTKKSSVVETTPSNQDSTPPKTTSGNKTSTNSGYKSSQSIVVMIALPMLAIFLVR